MSHVKANVNDRNNFQNLTLLNVNEKSVHGKSEFDVTHKSSKTLVGSSLDGKRGQNIDISAGRDKYPERLMPKLLLRDLRIKYRENRNQKKLACGDRFIANRKATDFERSHHLIMSSMNKKGENTNDEPTLRKIEYKEKLLINLNDGVPPYTRILSFKSSIPQTKDHINSVKALFRY
ncbi:UNVERIFIED_CONTAM: hypothetical protein RMT77_005568 [Armadillidium vulgare]